MARESHAFDRGETGVDVAGVENLAVPEIGFVVMIALPRGSTRALLIATP
jgi:hypothetical protein